MVPGDQLELHSRLVAQRAMMVKFECEALVDGDLPVPPVCLWWSKLTELLRRDPRQCNRRSECQPGAGVRIGPWSIIGPGVELADNVDVASHVIVKAVQNCRRGENLSICQCW